MRPAADPKRRTPTGGAERPGRAGPRHARLAAGRLRPAGGARARCSDGFRGRGTSRSARPILEYTELHERKSGAGIVSKLFELADGGPAGICLRPELTASIVRAYAEARDVPSPALAGLQVGPGLPLRDRPGGDRLRLREFTQVGVELLGAGGPAADAEVIAPGRAVARGRPAGPMRAIRIGHVGLIVEILAQTGLPAAASSALVEMLSAAAAEGGHRGARVGARSPGRLAPVRRRRRR